MRHGGCWPPTSTSILPPTASITATSSTSCCHTVSRCLIGYCSPTRWGGGDDPFDVLTELKKMWSPKSISGTWKVLFSPIKTCSFIFTIGCLLHFIFNLCVCGHSVYFLACGCSLAAASAPELWPLGNCCRASVGVRGCRPRPGTPVLWDRGTNYLRPSYRWVVGGVINFWGGFFCIFICSRGRCQPRLHPPGYHTPPLISCSMPWVRRRHTALWVTSC